MSSEQDDTRLTDKFTALNKGVIHLLQDSLSIDGSSVDGPNLTETNVDGSNNGATSEVDQNNADSMEPKLFTSNMLDQHRKLTVTTSTNNSNNAWQVKAYMPELFAEIRQIFNISYDMYRCAFEALPKFGVGQGKSGAKLYLTSDKYFIIKTMNRKEKNLLCNRYIPVFYKFLVRNHGHGGSLLPQFMGVYRCEKNGSKQYFVLIRNIFPRDCPIKCKYDLKGCFIDRYTTEEEKIRSSSPTLKDGNFIEDLIRIKLSKHTYDKFMSILAKDIEFLVQLKLMDYSLLIGLHDNTNDVDWMQNYYVIESEEPDVTYFVGVIDVLTKYNYKKKIAHGSKMIKNTSINPDISTINARSYGRRFLNFMRKSVFSQ